MYSFTCPNDVTIHFLPTYLVSHGGGRREGEGVECVHHHYYVNPAVLGEGVAGYPHLHHATPASHGSYGYQQRLGWRRTEVSAI